MATATSPDGEVASTTISVTAQSAPPSRLQLTAESSQGPSPQDTNFQLAFDGDIDSIQLIELDYDGDGNTDHVSINPFEDFSYTFANPGIYHPAATVTTSAETFTAGTAVVVEDLVQLDAFLRGRLGALVDGLATGDKQRALAVMSPGARKRFETLFDAIMPVIQANLSSWQAPQAIRISGNLAEYLILRNRDGKQYGYLVIFQRMPDGTWKLTTL